MADDTAAKPPRRAREPKREAGADEIAEKRARSDWTRAKLETLQAAIHDPRLNAKQFRLFAYILQCAHYRNRVAIVHDQMIMDEVPGFGDDETIRRNRLHLRETGWCDFIPGRGTRATVYTPRSDAIESVMSLIRIKAEARKANHASRKEALRAGLETLQQQHQFTNKMRGKRVGGSPQNAGELSCENEGISPALTPAGREKATGTEVVVALSEVVSCPECGTIAETGAEPGSRCAECEAEALRSEFEARQFPRSASGGFACFDCGAETELAARYRSEPYCPFCRDCIVEGEFPDVKRFAAPMSYAEASRGR